jgi:hypothetical protein
MFQQLLLVLVIQFGLAASVLAEPSKPTAEALRQVVSGRTVLLDTPIGSFPIRYRRDGTMTDQAPAFAANVGTEKDRGQWWVADDRLCHRWYRWLDAKQYCFKQQRVGAIVHWLRDDGLSGTATIRAPVLRLRLNVTRQPD